jgi:hypothetical protein
MSLIELNQFFEKNQSATLAQLHAKFNVDREILKEMLEFLVRKNKICCKTLKPACGKTCLNCDVSAVTLYVAVGSSLYI